MKKALELLQKLTDGFPPDHHHHGLRALDGVLSVHLFVGDNWYGFSLDEDDMQQPVDVIVERIRIAYLQIPGAPAPKLKSPEERFASTFPQKDAG